MLPNNFTLKSQEALQRAHNIAIENGQQALEPIHLLVALVTQPDGIVPLIIDKVMTKDAELRQELDRILETLPKSPAPPAGGVGQM
ncbi:MAG: Clp protease N-terminal domain-containing protein, partial [Patescibacteria group bacterium]